MSFFNLNFLTLEKALHLDQQSYRKLISGQTRGIGASFLRSFLGFCSPFYEIVIRVRNVFYNNGWLQTHCIAQPVISIGNITVGGTGKTPVVIYLSNWLTAKGIKVVILTRGYKAAQNSKLKSQNHSDEPAIIAESCPEAGLIVNADRVAGAAEAVNKYGAQVLLLDDGFQHRRLGRDVDIVTIDAMQPFGYGKLLPAGFLREPVSEIKRADAVIITRSDSVSISELNKIKEQLQAVKPDIITATSKHSAVCIKDAAHTEISIEQLKGKRVFAFCGIANPDAFMETITKLGAKLTGSKIYNDHHSYTNNDITDIRKQSKDSKAELILTTQKDWTKINTNFKSQISDTKHKTCGYFAYLEIKLRFISGREKIRALIEKALSVKIKAK
ncbi:tetraacyldisaccharide 4'-kinase [Planctomycetota bacterium]